MNTQIVVIAHNIRSGHNIGSLLRTCEGLGVQKVYLTGYTPYPKHRNDIRLPHIAERNHKLIHKTALGAEDTLEWHYNENINDLLYLLSDDDYVVAALEQDKDSINLPDYKPPQKLALLLGSEVEGIDPEIMKQVDIVLEIPMLGSKESFNVIEAASMALYHCTYGS